MLEPEVIVAMGRHPALQVQTPAGEAPALDDDGAARLAVTHRDLCGNRVRFVLDIENRVLVHVESLVLAALGGVIGAAATLLIFDGFIASTLGGSFTQVIFSFQLSPGLVAEGVILALLVGLIGGVFPAFRAARMPIVANLYS